MPHPPPPPQVLHDAFFKYQTKPKLSGMGELYYEGKEYEARLTSARPGARCARCARCAVYAGDTGDAVRAAGAALARERGGRPGCPARPALALPAPCEEKR